MTNASIRTRYTAPWGKELRLVTPLVFVICFGVAIIGFTTVPDQVAWARWLCLATGILIPLGCALCQIREYRLEAGQLVIQQRGWSNHLPLAELKEFRAYPQAMKGTLQVCGNGGVFAVYGFYWNKALGAYRAYASDLARAVVLRFSHRTVVVTPDDPEDFLRALEQLTKLNRADESAPAEVVKSKICTAKSKQHRTILWAAFLMVGPCCVAALKFWCGVGFQHDLDVRSLPENRL